MRCQATSSAPECNSAFSALFTLFTLFTPIIALSTSLHTSGNCIDLKEPHSSTFTKTKADIYVLLDLLASEEKKENRFSLFPLQHLVGSELAQPHIYDDHHIITSVSLITPFTNDHLLQLRTIKLCFLEIFLNKGGGGFPQHPKMCFFFAFKTRRFRKIS